MCITGLASGLERCIISIQHRRLYKMYATQRAEDAAHEYPLTKSMLEDPRRRGVPLFLQFQNRVPFTPAQQARWDERVRARAAGEPPGRSDFRKPKSMSWEEFDARQEAEAAARRAASYARIAVVKENYGDRHPARVPRVRGLGKSAAGSKGAMIAEMMLRPGGCTTAEVLSATGWPSVSMPAAARSAGLALRRERVGGVLRYYGSRG